MWAEVDSNHRRRKASRFTVCPSWPLWYPPKRCSEYNLNCSVGQTPEFRFSRVFIAPECVILARMRLPNRKPGKYTFPTFDPVMTEEKFKALEAKLDHILKVSRPKAIKDTQTYAENGDFSENAEYQIAKGRLRGLNKTIDEIKYQLANAEVIKSPTDTKTVQMGHAVTFSVNGIEKTFHILGSTEANPNAGVISYKSPLGALLLGHSTGDEVTMQVGNKPVKYKIVHIN